MNIFWENKVVLHLFGRIIVMMLATACFLPAAGAVERIGLAKAGSAPGPVVNQGGAIPGPTLAKVVAVKTPTAKVVALAHPPAGSAVTPIPPAVKTAAAKVDCQGAEGKQRRPVKSKRCEPQSLTYARQRSGIMSSRNGRENGPMTWFNAEKKNGRTTDEPTAGSVLILSGQGHGMPTGHVAYVEEVFPESPTTYRVLFSHTNYDRQCHLETDIEAFYDRAAMTLEVRSGAWRGWGRGLKVAGFIQDK